MASIRKNFLFTLISQLLVVLTPLLVMPFVARRLQVTNVGISSFTESIVYIFSIFAVFGCSIYGQREIAYCKDCEKTQLKRFLEIFFTVSLTAILSIVAFVIFIYCQTQYQLLYIIQILELIAYWWDVSWYYQGREDFKQLLLRNILIKGSYIVAIFIFIRDTNDLPLYVFLRCVTLLIGSIAILFPLLYKALKFQIKFSLKTIPKHFKGMFLLFLPSIAIMVYTVLDKTMIGIMTKSPDQNGCYEEAIKMIRVLMHIVASISIVLLPRIATLHASGKNDEIKQKLQHSFKFIYFLTFPMICGMCFIATPFVPLFLGPGFEGSIQLLQTLSILLFLIGIGRLLGTTLISMGKENIYTRNIIIGAISNFILNLVLIPRYQALGAAYASVIAEMLVTCAMIYSNRHVLSLPKLMFSSIVYLCAIVVMSVALFGIQALGMEENILQLFLFIFVGGITYVGVLLLLKDAFIYDIFRRMLVKFHWRRV